MQCMFFHATRVAKAPRLPNPGSSLLNPRSHRARVRRMMAIHGAQSEHFEQQALSADIAGSSRDGNQRAARIRPVHSRSQRKRHHIRYLGGQLAERVKSMSDSEWETVPTAEKHAFVKYMAQLLKEHPTQATEQQRRRYFETTMADPRSLDSPRTVTDSYERMKMGLPFAINHPQRSLGVSQAVYDATDASLFDPSKAHQLEDAMTQVKQVFTDFVTNKRQGRATEAQRRQLAHMTAELNLETQRHLASTFRYADEQVRLLAREEKERQMADLMRLRALLRSRRQRQSHKSDDQAYEHAETTPVTDVGSTTPRESTVATGVQTMTHESEPGAPVGHVHGVTAYAVEDGEGRGDKGNSAERAVPEKEDVPTAQHDTVHTTSVVDKTRNDTSEHDKSDAGVDHEIAATNNNLSFAWIQAEFDEHSRESAHRRGGARLTRRQRRARLKHFISKAMGVDVDVATSLLDELEAQEQFMQFCEIFARLTQGSGFVHRAGDEGLDAYTASIRTLYGVDAEQLSTLDVVQYLAAKDSIPTVEWARRWYERALLIPLTRTPEYRRLQAIQEEERSALLLSRRSSNDQQSTTSSTTPCPSSDLPQPARAMSASSTGQGDGRIMEAEAQLHTRDMEEPETISAVGTEESVSLSVSDVAKSSACATQNKVIDLVEKMFVRPDDARIKSIHEKRLRYMAYLQMERQISLARQNARRYCGVEHTPSAEQCRSLYAQLLARKRQLQPETTVHSTDAENKVKLDEQLPTPKQEKSETEVQLKNVTHKAHTASQQQTAMICEKSGVVQRVNNIFDDPTAASLMEKIRDIVIEVQRTYDHRTVNTSSTVYDSETKIQSEEKYGNAQQETNRARSATTSQAKAAKVARILQSVKAGDTAVNEIKSMLEEKKHRLMQRILSVVEKDVRSELTWMEAMQEAERPPLLTIPEGMSYVSAADVRAWRDLREHDNNTASNPFTKNNQRKFSASLLGQGWRIPDSPMLFWGTGTRAVQQALENAADDAERRRRGEPLAPPYPCAENPWGWRLVKDVLDD